MTSPKRSRELISRSDSHLLVIDVQEKLMPVIEGQEQIQRDLILLLDAAGMLGIPVTISEQYPQGLGATISCIAEHAACDATFEKRRFSAAEGFVTSRKELLQQSDRIASQMILVGIETHICVLQTAFDLTEMGYQVFVVADAVASRNRGDHLHALDRMRAAGVRVVTAESVLFEWCETAEAVEFRQISRLIRQRATAQ